MEITRIARHPRLERVRIHVDGEQRPRLEIALDLLLRSGLAVGDALDPAAAADLEREDEGYRAREAAIRLLAHRARSEAELRQRLARRDFAPALVDRTLAWLDERGYLDDRAFAEAFVRDRLRLRPRGRIGLIQELRRKGVDGNTAEAATDAVMAAEGVNDGGLALETARAWARKNAPLVRAARRDAEQCGRARRRLYGHLARRGFTPGPIRAATDAVLAD
jgi:regulatory protein